jgi:hypothetical protein
MSTEVQRRGLGIFADLGFSLEHEGSITVCLHHEGEFVARFSQTGATEDSLQGSCIDHLIKEHGWDGTIFKTSS